ncbi:MAG: hypothetical protein AAFY71_01630 [Bacteroidota bacterium]
MAFVPDIKYQHLVVKYLSGDIDLVEENNLRHWVDEHEKHAMYFDHMSELWEQLKLHPEAEIPDPQHSWQKLEGKLSTLSLSSPSEKKVNTFSLTVAMLIGGFLLLTAIYAVFLNRSTEPVEDIPALSTPDWIILDNRIRAARAEQAMNMGQLEEGKVQFLVNGKDSLSVTASNGHIFLRSSAKMTIIRSKNEQVVIKKGETWQWQDSSLRPTP